MILYIACTPDKYELPLFVAESAAELGEMLGIRKQVVYQYISRTALNNRRGKPMPKMLHFYKVVTEDGERCEHCRKIFHSPDIRKKYCSNRCIWAARREREKQNGTQRRNRRSH